MNSPSIFSASLFAVAILQFSTPSTGHAQSADGSDKVWREPSGQGVALAIEHGAFGAAWVQGLRVKVPLTGHWGLTLRGLMLHGPGTDPYRTDTGGRLGFYGGTLPVLNIMRLYGGGGVQLLAPASGSDDDAVRFGMGGHFGLEAFMSAGLSLYFEVGGAGSFTGAGSFGNGGTVIAGMSFYPF